VVDELIALEIHAVRSHHDRPRGHLSQGGCVLFRHRHRQRAAIEHGSLRRYPLSGVEHRAAARDLARQCRRDASLQTIWDVMQVHGDRYLRGIQPRNDLCGGGSQQKGDIELLQVGGSELLAHGTHPDLFRHGRRERLQLVPDPAPGPASEDPIGQDFVGPGYLRRFGRLSEWIDGP